MPRVKGGIVTRRKRNKLLKQAKGYKGIKKNTFKAAKETVRKAMTYAYRDRKVRKRDFRKLWITRINIAARQFELNYSTFISGLKKAQVDIDRKMLAELAVNDIVAFEKLTEIAKKSNASA